MADISIIMPARNAGKTIEESLKSVLTAPEVCEVIVVDDGSTDDTAAIARRLSDHRIRILPGPEDGISNALNEGFSAANGVFLARCDSDDLFPAKRLAWQRNWLLANPDFIAVSAGFSSMQDDGTHIADLACDMEAQEVTPALLTGKTITSFCTWLTRREAIVLAAGARPWFQTAEDIDLQFRLAEQGRVWHEPRVAYHYRLHSRSITHTRSQQALGFFDKMATEFAKQRLSTGEDDLSRGEPPPIPQLIHNRTAKRTTQLRKQQAGQMLGAAWRSFGSGNSEGALKKGWQAVKTNPYSLQIWKSWLMLQVRIIASKIL